MSRPTKSLGNAGSDDYTYSAIIDGVEQAFTIPAGETITVPVSDDEWNEIQDEQNNPPALPPFAS